MASENDNESVLAWAAATVANSVKKIGVSLYKDVTGGSIAAAGREGVKDVRDTMHQVFFGKGDGLGEPGAPLNPTQGEVAEMRANDEGSVHGRKEKPPHAAKGKEAASSEHGAKPLPSPSEIAGSSTPYGPKPHGNGPDHGQSQGR